MRGRFSGGRRGVASENPKVPGSGRKFAGNFAWSISPDIFRECRRRDLIQTKSPLRPSSVQHHKWPFRSVQHHESKRHIAIRRTYIIWNRGAGNSDENGASEEERQSQNKLIRRRRIYAFAGQIIER